MTIATTVALPVVRGPAHTAKLLAALHTLSDGRLVAGVGPGSSAADFAAAGVPFAERWQRFDEAVRVLRVLLGKDTAPFHGTFYSERRRAWNRSPRQRGTPPLWIASWGSTVGIRRVAELGDGWLASAYNTTPAAFRHALDRLDTAGRPAAAFPNAIATMWLHVTDRPSAADHVIDNVLAPAAQPTPGRPACSRTADRLSRAVRRTDHRLPAPARNGSSSGHSATRSNSSPRSVPGSYRCCPARPENLPRQPSTRLPVLVAIGPLEQRLDVVHSLVDSGMEVAQFGEARRHRGDGEVGHLDLGQLGPRDRRRDRSPRLAAYRVRRRDRPVTDYFGVLGA